MNASRPAIEIGWVIEPAVDELTLQWIQSARNDWVDALQSHLPGFDWSVSIAAGIRKAPGLMQPAGPAKHEPTDLLLEGLRQLEQNRWDFAFYFTQSALVSHQRANAIAMPSSALAVAVISAGQLRALSPATGQDEADAVFARRLQALTMHLLADLNGVAHSDDPNDLLYYPDDPSMLDHMQEISQSGLAELSNELTDVADTRLEEQPDYHLTSRPTRYLKGVIHLRRDIANAVIQAKPWALPFRLSSLSTAAISTLLILTMTAEIWALGFEQSVAWMSGFSVAAWLLSSLYVLRKQRLVVGQAQGLLTESRILADATIVLSIAIGMAMTYLLLVVSVIALTISLFSDALLMQWVPGLTPPVPADRYLAVAQLIASCGLAIGSLGSSFEGHHYFRHVAYVDEEI